MPESFSKIRRDISGTNRLEVNLLSKLLPSPLILGSGTLAEKYEQIQPYIDAGAGAVIPRTTRNVMERKVHPSPHLYQSGHKGSELILNAEWTGLPIDYWQPYLERLAQTGQVIMSVSGRDIKGCVEVCKIIDSFNLPLIEVNISCAHSNSVHGFITRNSQHISSLVKSIKDSGVKTPISLKLGHSDFIVELAQVAKEAGVNAITAINTFGPVLDFTIDAHGNPKPILGISSGKGGLSGAPIFNIALTDVAEIKRQVNIPVIGCGGVRDAEGVIKMMMAGADSVQIYTAAHVKGVNGPQVFTSINDQLLTSMNSMGIDNISEIIGRAIGILDQQTNLEPLIPFVNSEKCKGCGICLPICLHESIIQINSDRNKSGYEAIINQDSCVGCGHCVTVCPSKAIEV